LYLLDTNVISAVAPTAAAPPALVSWLEARTNELFLSAVTIAEIEAGIAKNRRQGATRKAADLTDWLAAVVQLYGGRILGFDIGVARVAGRLIDVAQAQGQAPGFADIMIAATGAHHGMTILTRNLRHFVPLGVKVVDPFAGVPLP
jgi:predicted nucleic acid-binding protein